MADLGRAPRPAGVYIAHTARLPDRRRTATRAAAAGRRGAVGCRNPVTGQPEWLKPVVKHRSEVLAWLAAAERGRRAPTRAPNPVPCASRSKRSASLWFAGVGAGRIGRRRGRGKPYMDSTLQDYGRSYRNWLRPQFGPRRSPRRSASSLAGGGSTSSRSTACRARRIAGHVSVASAIYAWALGAEPPARRPGTRSGSSSCRRTTRSRGCASPSRPRRRQLLAALEPEDRLPYAIAFYAGLRRCGDRPARVGRTCSTVERDRHTHPGPPLQERGRHRSAVHRSPSNAASRPAPRRGSARAARASGKVVEPLGHVGQDRGSRRPRPGTAAGLNRITLHECRHTYASLLMAAGYTIKELMEFMGHADLQMVNRYVKLLPQPGEDDARGAPQRVPASRNRSWPLGTSTRCRALRCTQRSSSVSGMRTSCPHRTTFRSGCTLRSKWLMLMPSEAAASLRVTV